MKEPNGGWSATYAVCGGCRICGVLMGPAAEADERRAAFIQHVRGPGPEHLLHSHLPHEEGLALWRCSLLREVLGFWRW